MRVRVKSKPEKQETKEDTLPLLSECRFHAAQLITEQEKCVCVCMCVLCVCGREAEREREREREREGERGEEERRAQKALAFQLK